MAGALQFNCWTAGNLINYVGISMSTGGWDGPPAFYVKTAGNLINWVHAGGNGGRSFASKMK